MISLTHIRTQPKNEVSRPIRVFRSMVSASVCLILLCIFTTAKNSDTANIDWPMCKGSYAADRFSPLQQITRENVSALREIGKYELQETTSFQSVPVVIGDAMYVATATATYALNAVTGELLWSQTYTTQPTPRKM